MRADDPLNPQRPPRTPSAVLEAAIKRINEEIVDAKVNIAAQEGCLQSDRERLARLEQERADLQAFIATTIPPAQPDSKPKRYTSANIAHLQVWGLPLGDGNPLGTRIGVLARMSDGSLFRTEAAHEPDERVQAGVDAVLKVANGETPNG